MVRFRQGFAWWSFAEYGASNYALLERAAEIGYSGVDFLPAELWQHARDCGLELVIIDGHETIDVGFNDRANHAALTDQIRRNLELASNAGVRNLSVASGNRGVNTDSEAISICAEALGPLAAEAEAAGVGLLLEPLNSKIDHPGHQCDSSAWGAAVIDLVDSAALRLLYDAYHMQIMEGDLLRTIETNIKRIGHFHTAGVPGRNELDDQQEVNWRAIAIHIGRLGYDRYVTHELIPRRDPLDALRAAFALFAHGEC